MALITATTTWQNVVTVGVEFWQCREGAVLVCNDTAAPTGNYTPGTLLRPGEGDRFPAGTIYYRSFQQSAGTIDRGVR